MRYLAEADRSVIQTIRCGILFVMAFWSGASFQSFARLKQVLSRLDSGGRLEVVVVDTDGCPDLYETPELVGKAFETFTLRILGECAAEPSAALDEGAR